MSNITPHEHAVLAVATAWDQIHRAFRAIEAARDASLGRDLEERKLWEEVYEQARLADLQFWSLSRSVRRASEGSKEVSNG